MSERPTVQEFFRGVTRNRGAIVSARVVTGLVGVGAAVAVVVAAGALPLPTIGAPVSSERVVPVASAQQRTCPGPALRLGDSTGAGANVAHTVGSASVTDATTSGTATRGNLEPTDRPANTPPVTLTLEAGSGGGADGADPDILAGSQSQTISDGELRGFAAAVCAPAAAESWLVGGSTQTGRTTLLLLANPSTVSATVDLSIYTETGLLSAAGTDGIIVAPGGQRVLSLAGFAPDVASPVIRVRSTGGEIVASLEQSIVRNLDPGGVDLVSASGVAGTLNVIPGVVLAGHDAIEAMLSGGGYEDAFPAVRVLVPGSEATTARITVTESSGKNPPVTVPVEMQPGVVTELPLDEFPDGRYSVIVETDVPAVAAVRATSLEINGPIPADPSVVPTLAGTDFAWFGSAPQLNTRALVAVASGPAPTLYLVNAGTSDTAVTVEGEGAPSSPVAIPAGGTTLVPVQAGASYTLTGFASVFASVSYQARAALAGFAVVAPEPTSQPITVFRGASVRGLATSPTP